VVRVAVCVAMRVAVCVAVRVAVRVAHCINQRPASRDIAVRVCLVDIGEASAKSFLDLADGFERRHNLSGAAKVKVV